MRRILLGAHVLPAVLGLIAVILSNARALDVAVWAFVLGWTLLVLALGWRRSARAKYLIAWILADALVMAGLQFIGTDARAIVSLVAIDGALFAAVFVSAWVALLQVAIAYSGLATAEFVRAQGSDLPSPGHGWQTPMFVTLAGILALRFLRVALDRLGTALAGRQATLKEEREILAEAAKEEAVARDVAALERELEPALAELEKLALAYAAAVPAESSAQSEARWLVESSGLARRELASLHDVLKPTDDEEMGDLIDTAILASSAAHPGRPAVSREIQPDLVGRVLAGSQARAVAGFVREAVTNALVHGAPPISVCAHTDGADLRVCVNDAGAGYIPGSEVRGLGLEAIEELARSVDGRIERPASADGHGHAVELVLGGGA